MPSLTAIALAALIVATTVCASPLTNLPSLQGRVELEGRQSGPSGSVQVPFQGLPGCNTQALDPSWAVGVSRWQDGEGVLVGSDCDNGAHGSGECWTEYFLVGTLDTYNDWYQAMGDIDCPENGTCAEAIAHLSQSCTTFTWSVSDSISVDISAIFESLTETITVTVGQSYQSCNSNTTTATCTWMNGGCNSIWAAQEITTVYGYKRRSCHSPSNSPGLNMPNSPMRPDGNYTRGMQDFQVPLAGISAIDCGGTCESAYHPPNLPTVSKHITPWPSTDA